MNDPSNRDTKAAAYAEDARVRFEALYERLPTWEIQRPQPAFIKLWEQGLISGSVLDVGCGTGENALFLAEKGFPVWGIDITSAAIGMARSKAAMRELPAARFLLGDALRLQGIDMVFDTIIDCGLFHALGDEERTLYESRLSSALRPDGLLHIHCYSDQEPGEDGPRRVSPDDIKATFSEGWKVQSITPSHIERTIRRGAAKAWIATIRRVG